MSKTNVHTQKRNYPGIVGARNDEASLSLTEQKRKTKTKKRIRTNVLI